MHVWDEQKEEKISGNFPLTLSAKEKHAKEKSKEKPREKTPGKPPGKPPREKAKEKQKGGTEKLDCRIQSHPAVE